jgi:hypothetical protein
VHQWLTLCEASHQVLGYRVEKFPPWAGTFQLVGGCHTYRCRITPVILAIWEAEIQSIKVWVQPERIVWDPSLYKITRTKRTEGVTQVLKYLLCKLKVLSSNLESHQKEKKRKVPILEEPGLLMEKQERYLLGPQGAGWVGFFRNVTPWLEKSCQQAQGREPPAPTWSWLKQSSVGRGRGLNGQWVREQLWSGKTQALESVPPLWALCAVSHIHACDSSDTDIIALPLGECLLGVMSN